MTRKGSTETVDASFGVGRLSIARAYLKAARNELLVADSKDIGNPAMKNHATIIETLRDVLGKRLPDARETNRRRILDEKDAVR